MSTPDISSPSLFDSSLAPEVTSVSPITAIPSRLDNKTAGNSRDTSKQKAPPAEDASGAEPQLDSLNVDLEAQAAPTLSSDLRNDLTSLLKDLTSGATSAAKADVSKVRADMQTQDGPSQTAIPLDSLISEISESLNSGGAHSVPQDGPQHDLASFLVDNGQGRGSLINTSA